MYRRTSYYMILVLVTLRPLNTLAMALFVGLHFLFIAVGRWPRNRPARVRSGASEKKIVHLYRGMRQKQTKTPSSAAAKYTGHNRDPPAPPSQHGLCGLSPGHTVSPSVSFY